MAGNKLGGAKAAATNKRKYGEDFYVRIGRVGGKLGHTGGFFANPGLARAAGSIGGKISKRGPKKPGDPVKVKKVTITNSRSTNDRPINLQDTQTRRRRVWDVFKTPRRR